MLEHHKAPLLQSHLISGVGLVAVLSWSLVYSSFLVSLFARLWLFAQNIGTAYLYRSYCSHTVIHVSCRRTIDDIVMVRIIAATVIPNNNCKNRHNSTGFSRVFPVPYFFCKIPYMYCIFLLLCLKKHVLNISVKSTRRVYILAIIVVFTTRDRTLQCGGQGESTPRGSRSQQQQ